MQKSHIANIEGIWDSDLVDLIWNVGFGIWDVGLCILTWWPSVVQLSQNLFMISPFTSPYLQSSLDLGFWILNVGFWILTWWSSVVQLSQNIFMTSPFTTPYLQSHLFLPLVPEHCYHCNSTSF